MTLTRSFTKIGLNFFGNLRELLRWFQTTLIGLCTRIFNWVCARNWFKQFLHFYRIGRFFLKNLNLFCGRKFSKWDNQLAVKNWVLQRCVWKTRKDGRIVCFLYNCFAVCATWWAKRIVRSSNFVRPFCVTTYKCSYLISLHILRFAKHFGGGHAEDWNECLDV